MVVKEYKIGQSVVRIHDDCMAKTQEENQAIIDRISDLVTHQYQKETAEKTA